MRVKEKKARSGNAQMIVGTILLCLGIVAAIIGFMMALGRDAAASQDSAVAFNPDSSAEKLRYIEMSMISDEFAEFDIGKGQGFYVAFNDDGSVCIVCMSDDQFEEHQRLFDYFQSDDETAQRPSAERVYGYPVKVNQELLGLTVDYINQLYEEEVITESSFSDLLGTYYLDATYRPSGDSSQMIAWFVTGGLLAVVGVLLLAAGRKQKKDGENAESISEFVLNDSRVFKNSYNMPVLEEKQMNYGRGILGAVLGSLAGAVIWVVVYQLRYRAGIAGYISAAGAIFGYKKFAGGINRIGVVLCTLISSAMLCGANVIACAWSIVLQVNEQNPGRTSLVYVLENFFTLMDSYDAWGAFFSDLAFGLVLILVAMFTSFKHAMARLEGGRS